MDMEDKIDMLTERVEQFAARLENIEFTLGIRPTSLQPLSSCALDEIRGRLTALEMATGTNGY